MDLNELMRVAQEYCEAREERLQLDAQSAKIKNREEDLKRVLMEMMREKEVNVVASGTFTISFKEELEPSPGDWTQIYAYIRDNNAFELLHKRLTKKALDDRRAEGETVPGVEWSIVPTITVKRGK